MATVVVKVDTESCFLRNTSKEVIGLLTREQDMSCRIDLLQMALDRSNRIHYNLTNIVDDRKHHINDLDASFEYARIRARELEELTVISNNRIQELEDLVNSHEEDGHPLTLQVENDEAITHNLLDTLGLQHLDPNWEPDEEPEEEPEEELEEEDYAQSDISSVRND